MVGQNRYIYTNCIITSAHTINDAKDYIMGREFKGNLTNGQLMFCISKIEVNKC